MKEIAVTASTGKHDNELIGRCNIPLRVNTVAKQHPQLIIFFDYHFHYRRFLHLAWLCGSA